MLSRAYHKPFFREDSSAKDGYVGAYVAEFDLVKPCNKEHDVDCSECPPLGNMQDSLQQEYPKYSLHVTSNIVSAPGHYCHDHQSQMYLRFAKEPTATRTATIVMCGSFSPEDITMPDCIADAKDSVLCARMIDRRGEQNPSLLLDLVFEPFFATSPGHGRRASHPSPPPPLQLDCGRGCYRKRLAADTAWKKACSHGDEEAFKARSNDTKTRSAELIWDFLARVLHLSTQMAMRFTSRRYTAALNKTRITVVGLLRDIVRDYLGQDVSTATLHYDGRGTRKIGRRKQTCPSAWNGTPRTGGLAGPVQRCPERDQPDWRYQNNRVTHAAVDAGLYVDPKNGDTSINRLATKTELHDTLTPRGGINRWERVPHKQGLAKCPSTAVNWPTNGVGKTGLIINFPREIFSNSPARAANVQSTKKDVQVVYLPWPSGPIPAPKILVVNAFAGHQQGREVGCIYIRNKF
ncbi:hypothetical protein CCHR01_19183 [Colletotrichum chrysophilum]|uniref:Uncharacterized protein n=1 Tax=Colletotrichum chrysophilum TaxID=1836956 RepID=A0AAD8ZYQ1_9PEZI|nr:hypothetical protein CCHR01_19183 [Colletotrichum chrysophilum]